MTLNVNGKSLAAICEQVKDPARNGGKSLPQLVHHNAEDSLVGWGWAPHARRADAPTRPIIADDFGFPECQHGHMLQPEGTRCQRLTFSASTRARLRPARWCFAPT